MTCTCDNPACESRWAPTVHPCNQVVYRGSQYNRIAGRQCRRDAVTEVSWPGSRVREWLCRQHADQAVARGADELS